MTHILYDINNGEQKLLICRVINTKQCYIWNNIAVCPCKSINPTVYYMYDATRGIAGDFWVGGESKTYHILLIMAQAANHSDLEWIPNTWVLSHQICENLIGHPRWG